MNLLKKYLSKYDYNETHSIVVDATPSECYQQTFEIDLAQSKIISFLFKMRGMPFSKTKFRDFTNEVKFTLLEEDAPSEFLYGFWANSNVEWVRDKETFINGGKGYRFQSVWNFKFEDLGNAKCLVSTETRVKCLTKATKFFFSIYWFFIKSFSGLIRKEMLRLIKKEIEKAAHNMH
jgi:hypothetical protein